MSQKKSWNDFNDAAEQNQHDIIPSGTLVKVRMTIKPGGFDNPDGSFRIPDC
ncbi:hypothetical protein [Endozoicomonas atrinae]|uniref:hypothetical protein n=1 Tax=Endozoicomonas atrinae TaxID=1333660 RepID=UPI003B0015DE